MTWNIAHRGGAGLTPENTLPAFRHAIQLGCDGAELDVQLSADGVVVVHHDFRLNRAYARRNGVWLKGETPRIKDLRFEEMKTLDLGRPDPASDYARSHPALVPADGATVPSLAEVVALPSPKIFHLLVELKSSGDPASADPVALADAALAVMKDDLSRTIFVGFDWRGLARIKSVAPEARCWFTTDKLEGDVVPVLDFIKAAGGDGWFPHHRDATPATIAQARVRGLQVAAWTVNAASEMTRLIAQNLDALCTDRPDILQTLEQRG
jgi:glycerophosphoryl diester phosphodiesterase